MSNSIFDENNNSVTREETEAPKGPSKLQAAQAEDKLGLFALNRKTEQAAAERRKAYQVSQEIEAVRCRKKAEGFGVESPLDARDWQRLRERDPLFYNSEAGKQLRAMHKTQLGIMWHSPNKAGGRNDDIC